MASMIVTGISLGLIIILRSGTGDPDRRSFTSELASNLGIIGLASLPLIGGSIIWGFVQQAAQGENAAGLMGVVIGTVIGVGLLGRGAFGRGHR